MLFKYEIGFNLWSFYDLLGFLLLHYLPAMGGYYALETAQVMMGLFRKLNQQNHTVPRLFFLYRRHLSLPQMSIFFIASRWILIFWISPFPEQSLICFPCRNRHFLVGHISGCLYFYVDYKRAVTMQGKDMSCFAAGGNTGNLDLLAGVFL